METCIRLRGVEKVFPVPGGEPVRAVKGIDLEIGSGEIVALLGPNGAGKTTTIDMILGFAEPTAGEVSVFAMSPRQAVAQARVSAVLQTGGLLRDLTVRETVQLIASTYGKTDAAADDVIESAGLAGRSSRMVAKCSGGEQQRLRFALALLADPDLLLLDEPTAGMDVEARQSFWATMRTEAQAGRTIVFATHYLQEAEDFAARTVLLASGLIVADGPTDLVRKRAAGRTVRASVAAEHMSSVVSELRARAGVRSVSTEGDRVVVDTTESDLIARRLLDLGGFDLEIEPASLERAFLELTNR